LLGLQPSMKFKLDSSSSLRFTAGFDYILWQKGGYDLSGDRVDLAYAHWTFGTHYEVSL
jgi:hypothetical protein